MPCENGPRGQKKNHLFQDRGMETPLWGVICSHPHVSSSWTKRATRSTAHTNVASGIKLSREPSSQQNTQQNIYEGVPH